MREKPATPMWSGTIAYGAVRVPVRLWRAQPTDRPAVPLKTLHAQCMAPVQRVERCSSCAAELRAEDKISVVEVSPGEYVPVDRDELPHTEADERHILEVEDWIPLAQLDPIQLNGTYYLAPAENAAPVYALLHRAMLQTGVAGIGRITLRTRESLCAVYPRGDYLVVSTLHLGCEMTALEDLPAGADGVAVDERSFEDLISTLARHCVTYNPYSYRDRVADTAALLIEERLSQVMKRALPATRDQKVRALGDGK